jgi:predicted CXXCH cytochrome family protein
MRSSRLRNDGRLRRLCPNGCRVRFDPFRYSEQSSTCFLTVAVLQSVWRTLSACHVPTYGDAFAKAPTWHVENIRHTVCLKNRDCQGAGAESDAANFSRLLTVAARPGHRRFGALALLACLSLTYGARAQSNLCIGCHPKAGETYSRTGMARSFYRPRPENTIEDYSGKNTYYHKASDISFAMIERDGRYFQRQFQIGPDGKQTNLTDTEIDFVLGSGNRARTYLHRAAGNTLVELPLGWYSEKGGSWAMNPGYDRPDHQGARRAVTYDCMFCHNGYPEIPARNSSPRSSPAFLSVPKGIDCQRCHGRGDRHIQLARRAGARPEEIRNAIVNPSRLTPERQMEACMQCHLETTSSPLPASIVRYERGPFSYQPGEPLGDFMLHFDQAPGKGYDNKFEITGAAYRLRQSACFRKTNGSLTCTTCHDPHAAQKETARTYADVCRQCHAPALERLVSTGKHTSSEDCAGCHMPKRRTDDVVHAVMTDHFIQRQKPARDLLAERTERLQTDSTAYRGNVDLYYPTSLPKAEDELYLAIAQISQNSNLSEGIARLSAAVAKYHPARAEYYLQLGDGLSNAGRFGEAIPVYEEAIRREPESAAALERLAASLSALKQNSRAEVIFKQALALGPNAGRWVELGMAYLGEGKSLDAISAFEKAAQFDPDMAEAHNSAGAIQFEIGDSSRAEVALRNAIHIQPNYAQAHNNLGNLLSGTGRFAEAEYHFKAALRYKENYIGARYNYALALSRVHRLYDAQVQLEAILLADPGSAEAHEFLGTLLVAQGQPQLAIEQFREAIRIEPGFSRAVLDLGRALANSGDVTAALPYIRRAAQSTEVSIRNEAANLLQKLARPH